jgi:hypothetical protein
MECHYSMPNLHAFTDVGEEQTATWHEVKESNKEKQA